TRTGKVSLVRWEMRHTEIAASSCVYWFGSCKSARSRGKAGAAFVPILPSAHADQARTNTVWPGFEPRSESESRVVRSPTAEAPRGPIWPIAQADRCRTSGLESLRQGVRAWRNESNCAALLGQEPSAHALATRTAALRSCNP